MLHLVAYGHSSLPQGRIQDLIRGGAPDRDRPKTAILGPQFCRILVLGPHFWWSRGGARAPGAPPLDPPLYPTYYLVSLIPVLQFSCSKLPPPPSEIVGLSMIQVLSISCSRLSLPPPPEIVDLSMIQVMF